MKLKNLKILIFDIDGVLVYVGDSYRKAIVETVQYYFSDLIGLKLESYLITANDTQKFKLISGFNDDWELTYAVILCYLAKMSEGLKGFKEKTEKPRNLSEMVENLKELGKTKNAILELDIDNLTSKIKENNGGIEGTEKALTRIFGRNLEIAKKFWFTDLIKKIFQEFYLGEKFFEEKYGERPIFIHSQGFIRNENPLITIKTLEKLGKKFYLGISTGRERFEVEKTMKIHGFDKFFAKEVIVAREDTKVRKPDPSSLLECRRRIRKRYELDNDTKTAYIGDIPDDIRTAKNAGFYSIGCLSAVSDLEEKERLKKEFKNLKCDLILENAEELKKFINKKIRNRKKTYKSFGWIVFLPFAFALVTASFISPSTFLLRASAKSPATFISLATSLIFAFTTSKSVIFFSPIFFTHHKSVLII